MAKCLLRESVPDSAFCSRFTGCARMIAWVIFVLFWEASHFTSYVTAFIINKVYLHGQSWGSDCRHHCVCIVFPLLYSGPPFKLILGDWAIYVSHIVIWLAVGFYEHLYFCSFLLVFFSPCLPIYGSVCPSFFATVLQVFFSPVICLYMA